ncbi:MAG: cache domain-containing protein [Sedimentisphaerales bacterium]|nr:cache domain-containing protein [Sedimentisphaerales bacterium]
MTGRYLKTKLLVSLVLVIAALSIPIALLGAYIIKKNIIGRTELQVLHDLRAARLVYNSELERIRQSFNLVSFNEPIEQIRNKIGLHYLDRIDIADINNISNELVRAAFEKGVESVGTRIISTDELSKLNNNLKKTTLIKIRTTPRAIPTDKLELHDVMAKECAMPFFDDKGKIKEVIYGGRIINRDYLLVDRIKQIVFGNDVFDSKPVGTVTIFQNDTRISTNVLDEDGNRAIGTRVSAEVFEKVIKQGQTWHDRAFVVTHWYKTAYEPIRNINNKVIGMLYVGILEKPFEDMALNIIILFLGIVGSVSMLAIILAYILVGGMAKSLTGMLNAIRRISEGKLDYRISSPMGVAEFDELVLAFNDMSEKLNEREQSLRISNEKLVVANENYVELIGFVAHELKGILASAVMNIYALKEGLLGLINFKQQKAVDSVARNLDYLTATVRKFLNLGIIERGQLKANKTQIDLKKDVFAVSIDALSSLAAKKNIHISNNMPDDFYVAADGELMQIVANNLLSNAIKYGYANSNIIIYGTATDNECTVEVFNESDPISDTGIQKLFKKFSRLDNIHTKKEKGTGLGLYITQQIILEHGGDIRVEPREHGNAFIFKIERS